MPKPVVSCPAAAICAEVVAQRDVASDTLRSASAVRWAIPAYF